MTLSAKNNPFNITAFTIAALAFTTLHGTMLMGFESLASTGHNGIYNGNHSSTQVAKTLAVPRTVTLDRVVISTRRA